MMNSLLMVFVKNAVLGTAKTRLAASVGDKKALEIYEFLLKHTAYIASGVPSDRQVLYNRYIEQYDMFSAARFEKKMQIKGGLGEKMLAAFQNAFGAGYEKIVVIGSDCFELNENILKNAFKALDKHDFVLGPAKDGGYYLLGMRQIESVIFKNKKWSTDRVYTDTVIDLEALGYSYFELPRLSDIDVLEDLPSSLRKKFGV